MKRFMKILHEVGSLGLVGALAAVIVLIVSAQGTTPSEYAAVRRGIDLIARWVVVPSLGVCLASGMLAIGLNRGFHNAGWAWIKAALGVSVLEGTLGGISGTARDASAIAAAMAVGQGDPQKLAEVLRHEWGVLWVMLGLSLANIVLGVWRPKLTRAKKPAPVPALE